MAQKATDRQIIEAARALLPTTKLTRDALPYTDEFESLFAAFDAAVGGGSERRQLWLALSSLAKKGGWKGKKRGEQAPEITTKQGDVLRKLIAGRLGKRDTLVYTNDFETLRDDFNKKAGLKLTSRQFWRVLCNVAKRPQSAETENYLAKAVDSLVLAVDHFNRSADRGRLTAVLIFLDHAFEMFLKAALLHRGGVIRDATNGFTLDFKTCVNKATDDGQIRFLTDDERRTLRLLNGLRDQAQHDVADITEPFLYTVAQSSLNLFAELLSEVFGRQLGDHIPRRVLPISTEPPRTISVVMDQEFSQLKQLIKGGRAAAGVANVRLRSLMVIDRALNDETELHVPDADVAGARQSILQNTDWNQVFKGIAQVVLTGDAPAMGLALQIHKHDGLPVKLAAEGDGAALAIRKIDETSYYCFNTTQLAEKAGLSMPRLLAVVHHLELQKDSDLFKEIAIDRVRFKRYSHQALTRIKGALPELDIEQVWRDYSAKQTEKSRRRRQA